MRNPADDTSAPLADERTMSVRHAAMWSIGSQYLGFVMQFASSVIISRFFLAPAEIGLFSIALAVAMLVSILQDFGLNRYISNLPHVTHADINQCSSVSLIFALIIGGALALGAYPIASFYRLPELAPIILIISISYVFAPFAVVPSALMIRTMAFRGLFLINIGGAAVQTACAITLAWMGFSAASLAWAMVAAALVKAIIAQVLRPALPFPLRFAGVRPILAFGSQTSALFVIGAIGSRTADLIIGWLINLTSTGLFTRATGLTTQVRSLISGAAGGVLYPTLARLQREGEDLGPYYLRVVACFTAATWPAMAGLAVAAQPTVHMLFGPAWAGTAPVLSWIAVGELLFIALPLHIELPMLRNRIRPLIARNIVDTIAAVTLLYIGASISLHAAAMSRVAYGVCWLAIYVRFICGIAGIKPRQLLPVYLSSGCATLAAIAPMGLAALTLDHFSTLPFLALAALAGTGVALWLVTLLLLRHPLADELIALLGSFAVRLRHIRKVT